MLEAFTTSTVLVALAEMGDKTQLLSLMLAARYRKPYTIMGAILVATLLNHALAALLGHELGEWVQNIWFSRGVAASFIVLGVWILVPDRLEEDGVIEKPTRSIFITTTTCFFMAEMGDKTQLATMALGAQFSSVMAVVAGTTCGMMLANAPVVLLGEKLLRIIPMKQVRRVTAVLFITLGIGSLGLHFIG